MRVTTRRLRHRARDAHADLVPSRVGGVADAERAVRAVNRRVGASGPVFARYAEPGHVPAHSLSTSSLRIAAGAWDGNSRRVQAQRRHARSGGRSTPRQNSRAQVALQGEWIAHPARDGGGVKRTGACNRRHSNVVKRVAAMQRSGIGHLYIEPRLVSIPLCGIEAVADRNTRCEIPLNNANEDRTAHCAAPWTNLMLLCRRGAVTRNP